jgi:hypothetical protein
VTRAPRTILQGKILRTRKSEDQETLFIAPSCKDAGISLDPKLGHDPEATAKTVAAVTGELRGVFNLP